MTVGVGEAFLTVIKTGLVQSILEFDFRPFLFAANKRYKV